MTLLDHQPKNKAISDLLASYLDFEKFSRSDTRVSKLFSRGVELYKQLPDSVCASLYLLNEECFELEHANTNPAEERAIARVLFEVLLEENSIGKALSTGTIQEFSHDSQSYEFGLVIPLISSSIAVGIVIVTISRKSNCYDQTFLGLISTISSAFANMFVSKRLSSKLEKSREILDQKVASKTIELTESKQNLFEKFENFRSSITMSIPHEVMTPLNHILGFSEYLLDATGDIKSEENQEIFLDIHNAANRLNHLFESYIFYNRLNLVASKIESLQKLKDDIIYSTEPFVENLINSEFLDKQRSEDTLLELIDAPVAVAGEYFKKIVQELYSNAIKYSDAGTPIKISTKLEGDFYHLSCEDHGRGMSPEQVKNIEAFVQFDRALYEQQGTGLGMAIISRIVDIYNGTIKVQSSLGEGTTVTVALPLAKVH